MNELKNLYIIIAEDDFDDAEIVEQAFAKNKHFIKVEMVRNGFELLDSLRNKEAGNPDIILTDINMPIMDGIEALKVITADKQLSEIPAFVYSTSINPIYEAKCNELGIRGYLIKPYSITAFDNIPDKIISMLSK